MDTLRTLIYEIFLKTFNEKRKKVTDIYIYIYIYSFIFYIYHKNSIKIFLK